MCEGLIKHSCMDVMKNNIIKEPNRLPTFVDLFAGCGGLSLGLLQAGWRGVFAVEKQAEAFKTLKHNLVDSLEHNVGQAHFNWHEDINQEPCDIQSFVSHYRQVLQTLNGQIDLVAGGPPCQGFSFAGKRKKEDPRNTLFKHYIEIVRLLDPKLILIENVEGISIAHGGRNKKKPEKSYYDIIKEELEDDFEVRGELIRSIQFGIPQKRPRFFIIGVNRKYINRKNSSFNIQLGEWLRQQQATFMDCKNLPNREITVGDAILDLCAGRERENTLPWNSKLQNDYYEIGGRRFRAIKYKGPMPDCGYQQLMNKGMKQKQLNGLRLANHRPATSSRFRQIIALCKKEKRQGVQITKKIREQFGMKKQMFTILNVNKPSHTITTLPDDLLHFDEPRILTARECARIQSFPDWFEFQGAYTTGGSRRALSCPRYTQIGNAVPPLLAEQLGNVLMSQHDKLCEQQQIDMESPDFGTVIQNIDHSEKEVIPEYY
jgi:DNA (cytosine-5)-methyltransferase 1